MVEPYIIEAEDSGFDIDIVREIFALEDVVIRFVHQPLQRTKVSFKNETVDVFKQAKIGLGKEFELMAENNPEYQELSDQKEVR